MLMKPPNSLLAQLDQVPAVRWSCGWTRRTFADSAQNLASADLVEILGDARPHYHQRTTEIYVVLEGQDHMELDGQLFPVKPMTAVYIKPGCRHRAVGRLKVLNLPAPAFDPADEWFD
jgi:mannose-6-phosphate isomerase-like protein (cupin superfamily)